MTETANFKCLRCGHQYTRPYDPETGPQERMCPKCRSNSVRRLKKAKQETKAPGGGKK